MPPSTQTKYLAGESKKILQHIAIIIDAFPIPSHVIMHFAE